MKEYRITARYNDVYPLRSYRRRTYYSLDKAEADLKEAEHYYRHSAGSKYLVSVKIESREVTEWEEV